MSQTHLLPDQAESILTYLDIQNSADSRKLLSESPISFLNQHISNLPISLLRHFTSFLSPKELNQITVIKHRRLLYATPINDDSRPRILSASQGRLRWPLLWESLGGDPHFYLGGGDVEDLSSNAVEEEQWVSNGFMADVDPDKSQQVKKLGGFLRLLEEERESEFIRRSKRMERSLDNQGEEFDDESDDEDQEQRDGLQQRPNGGTVNQRVEVKEDQNEVERIFEKRLLEIFLDGMDTIDYTEIDFNEPPGGDPIAIRDAEDRYFDDEEPSKTPNGHEQGRGDGGYIIPKTEIKPESKSMVESRLNENGSEKLTQNGQGEYDY